MKTFPWLLLAALALSQVAAAQVDCANRSVCSDPDGKVCGSDGLTYDDKCAFETAFCANSGRELSIASEGACEPSEAAVTPAPTVTIDIPDEVATPAPTTVKPVEDAATETTTPSAEDANSDIQQIIIDIPASGGAATATTTSGSPSEAAASSYPTPNPATTSSYLTPNPATKSLEVTATGAIRAKCNPICPKVYVPVCGSDAITYANQCLLDYASCRTESVVKVGDGKCSKRKKGKSCIPQMCTSVKDPICGSDGTTYLNACMFDNAQCMEPLLTVLHDGECNADTKLTCESFTCPKFTECREDAETSVAYCADICAAERCGAGEECQLLKGDCFTAPCSRVATCVSADIQMF